MSHSRFSVVLRPALLAVSAAALLATTGCAIGGTFSQAAPAAAAAGTSTVQGHVHGGNQPVSGASVQLYYAGAPATGSGYGVGGTALMTNPVMTDSNGDFSISGLYTCPTPAAQVYIVATGGNPGLGGTVNNSGLAMMTALGTCPAGGNLLATIPNITINEVTTVAAVFALQQFMAAPSSVNHNAPSIGAPTTSYATGTSIGSVQSAVIGMNNAFVTAKVLADPALGVTPNTNYAYATPESAKINTIANILAYCVNSDPTQSSNCSSLFTAATPTGATYTAADTIQAAWYMAQNPINNITTLYNFVAGAGAPFLPDYVAPYTQNSTNTGLASNSFNDTTIAINYAPTVSSTPAVGVAYGVAIDAFGNAWVSNAGGLGGVAASVTELGVDGSALFAPVTSFTVSSTGGTANQFSVLPTLSRTFVTPKAVAIDLNNRPWITNEGDSATGTAIVPVEANTPQEPSMTSDVAVFGASTTSGLAGAGGPSTSPTGYFVGYQPWGIAVDGSNNVWVQNSGTNESATCTSGCAVEGRSMGEFNQTANTYSYSTTGTTVAGPNELPGGQALVAVDANPLGPFVWDINYNTCKTIGQFNGTTPFGTISLYSDSTDLALSGSEIATSYSGATVETTGSSSDCGSSTVVVGQLMAAAMSNPYGIAIDRNNGAWISDVFTSSLGFDGLTYVPALTGSTGSVNSSGTTFLVNGVLPTSTTAGIAGSTLHKAGADAVDGNNNVWIANQTASSVAEAALVNGVITLLTPGQGSNLGTGAAYGVGFQHSMGTSTGIAIDPSGNVWVTNQSTVGTYTNQAGSTSALVGNTVTVVVGAAGPVVTPLSLAIKSNKLGQKP